LAIGVKVLIVDDNPGIRRMLKRAIGEVAEKIWDCADGAQAQSSYMDHRPDVVLMDIRMPQVDGLEATRQILRVDPSARVVIVTDYDDEDLRRAAAEAGACGFSLKEDLMNLPRILGALLGTDRT
jgi:two-component system response regulator DegU